MSPARYILQKPPWFGGPVDGHGSKRPLPGQATMSLPTKKIKLEEGKGCVEFSQLF
jgi:hypothetical protein